jgi:hypothetical protein
MKLVRRWARGDERSVPCAGHAAGANRRDQDFAGAAFQRFDSQAAIRTESEDHPQPESSALLRAARDVGSQDGISYLVMESPSAMKNGQFSSDGKWVAYASNETGKWEIYVTSFPDAHGKWQLSSGGGRPTPLERRRQRARLPCRGWEDHGGSCERGATFNPGFPVALFQANQRALVATSEHVAYDVTQDSQRFLINTHVKSGQIHPMSVVLNWD